MDWTALENRLAQAIGLDSSSLGTTVFRQAVNRRMRTREVATPSKYIELIDAEPVELQALVEVLVVRESWFFRLLHMHLTFFAGTRCQRQRSVASPTVS